MVWPDWSHCIQLLPKLDAVLQDFRTRFETLLEEPSSVPNHYDIIHRALLEPFLSESALGDSLLSGAPNTDYPMSSAPPMQRRGLGGATHHGKESYDDEPTDSDNEAHSDGKLRMEKRIMPKEKHGWNRPAKRRNWEFVPGTDLEVAEVGKPDPSKFFLVRQNKDNPLEKDIRQYAGWETLDWDDPNDIESLNSARRQVRKRTSGKIAVSRMPYTQMEKDVLKNLVQQAIQSGKDRLTIDWDEISRNMSKHFEGIVQEPGQPMARTSKVVAGQEKTPKHKVQTLKTRRNGTANRAGRAIQAQAESYGDIWLMLIASKPLGKRGRRKKETEVAEKEKIELDNAEEETELPSNPKRRRTGTEDIAPGPKMPPGPPPPPGGAGGIAGPMGEGFSLALAQTTLPSH